MQSLPCCGKKSCISRIYQTLEVWFIIIIIIINIIINIIIINIIIIPLLLFHL